MEDYLYHWGVKGKSGRYPWGSGEDPYQRITRKAKQAKTRRNIKVSKKARDAVKKNVETVKEKKKEMTDDELRSAISRLQLERQYKTLVSELNPKPKHVAKDFLMTTGKYILSESMKEVGKQAATHYLGKAVNYVSGEQIYLRKGEKKDKKQDD